MPITLPWLCYRNLQLIISNADSCAMHWHCEYRFAYASMKSMSYQVRLPVFEGPFELLFHLIEQEEVAIWDIPIARIAEQYLEYIATMQELDLELAGEFLVMAATLLAIKARLLLPQPEADEAATEEAVDPRMELVARLLEYRRFREAAHELSQLGAGRDRLFARGYTPPPVGLAPLYTRPIGKATISDLAHAMRVVLEAYQPPPPTVAVPRRRLTVEGRVADLQAMFARNPFCSFHSLLPKRPTRQDVVVTFLALLELIRRGMLRAKQPTPFGSIDVTKDMSDPPSKSQAGASDDPLVTSQAGASEDPPSAAQADESRKTVGQPQVGRHPDENTKGDIKGDTNG